MHVEWGWIKQRPHFIAEELSREHYLKVYYQTRYAKFERNKNSSKVQRARFFTIPKNSNPTVSHINSMLLRTFFHIVAKFGKYDVIYLTHPTQLNYLPNRPAYIIYDCMDDHSSFYKDSAGIKLKNSEIKLFDKADLILFSSFYLREKNKPYIKGKNVKVILNGVSEDLKIIEVDRRDLAVKPIRNIFYIGTIAEWFDFSVIEIILDRCPLIRFTIVGPTDIRCPNMGERVEYLGSIDHSRLVEIVKEADAFIMPFRLTDLIRAVDPVKMYEYIAFGKPIISIFYDELEKFSDFVNFYKNNDQLEIICQLINDSSLKLYNLEHAKKFISNSTWKNRVEGIFSECIINDK
ncbi:glycosyltransferase [Deinococcus irradiatisoli]|nr:glycosyltransferase [Deinococcus irradiatisoli]